MKTMSSTSITSTNGVTLISLIGFARAAAMPAARAASGPIGMRHRSGACSSTWRDRIAENSSAKAFEPLADLARLA